MWLRSTTHRGIRCPANSRVVCSETLHSAPSGGQACSPNGLCSYFDTQFPNGTSDGAGAFHNDGGFTVYEFSHPLTAKDPYDFSRAPRQTLGLTLFLRMIAAGAVFPSGFGDTTYPTTGFLQITIQ